MNKLSSREIGRQAEALCRSFLESRGMRMLEHNYHTPFGELDLIMRDREHVVFVEVRFRSNQAPYSALESIGPNKQQKIIKAASLYAQKHKNKDYYRFDVITLGPELHANTIDWIRDAFYVES